MAYRVYWGLGFIGFIGFGVRGLGFRVLQWSLRLHCLDGKGTHVPTSLVLTREPKKEGNKGKGYCWGSQISISTLR